MFCIVLFIETWIVSSGFMLDSVARVVVFS